MDRVLLLSLLFALSHTALISQVTLGKAGSTDDRIQLLESQVHFFSIDTSREKLDLAATLCPEDSTAKYRSSLFVICRTVSFQIRGLDDDVQQFVHDFQSSTDCVTVRSGEYTDGTSGWNAVQGLYMIQLQVSDGSTILSTTTYSLGILRPSSIQFRSSSELLDGQEIPTDYFTSTPLSLSLPSIQPHVVRWVVNGNDYQTTTTK